MEMQKIAAAIAALTEVATSGFSLSILPTSAGVTAYAHGHESNANISYRCGDTSATDRIVDMLNAISEPLAQAEKAREVDRRKKVQARYDAEVSALDGENKKLSEVQASIKCHVDAEEELLGRLAEVRSSLDKLELTGKSIHIAREHHMKRMGELAAEGAVEKYSNTQRPIGESTAQMEEAHIDSATIAGEVKVCGVLMVGDTVTDEFEFPTCRGHALAYSAALAALRGSEYSDAVKAVARAAIKNGMKEAIEKAMQPGGALYR